MIQIEIDGKKMEVKEGSMIIQAADEAGIYIPRFCYHKKLSIAANCRMCLVEVEKAPKTLPACATPVTDGMKVHTQSEKTVASQKAVMEFLLINHPLDCPICDQGGECELQDLSLEYGAGTSRFRQAKRSVEDKNLGPLISSEMTRCIYCTRCVRYGTEVAGMRELGVTGRGEESQVGTYVQHMIESEVSGNVIDLCPVGALTSKPYRFTARAWEMRQHAAIAPHDCVGSNIFIHTRGEEYSSARHVMRVVPRENENVNETWISDRDRYSYEAVNSETRLQKPMVKRYGEWEEVSWDVAFHETVQALQNVLKKSGAEKIGGVISPSVTLEEMYLFQKWMRTLGSQNIDHRIHQTDFTGQETAPLYPGLGLPIEALDHLDACLLIGSNVRQEQPIINIRLRKAALKGAQILCVNPIDDDINLPRAEKCIVAGVPFISTLAEIAQVLYDESKHSLPDAVTTFIKFVTPSKQSQSIAKKLLESGKSRAILLGAYALNHRQASVVRLLAEAIAELSGATLGYLTEGANAAGAWLSGVLPHRQEAGKVVESYGLDSRKMFKENFNAYVLYDIEIERDMADMAAAWKAVKNADVVIAFTAFSGDHLKEYADIILPITPFAETAGTYVNVEGKWQSMGAAGSPQFESRQGWEILKDLLTLFAHTPVSYETVESVRHELKHLWSNMPKASELDFKQRSAWFNMEMAQTLSEQVTHSEDTHQPQFLERIGYWPMYQIDMLVRNAKSLQLKQDNRAMARIHPNVAQKLGLKDGTVIRVAQNNQSITLPLVIDDRMADGFVQIPAGLKETAGFGDIVGQVDLSA